MAWLRHGQEPLDWRRFARSSRTLDDARTTVAAQAAGRLGTVISGKVRGLHVRAMLRHLRDVDAALLIDGVGLNILERCPAPPRSLVVVDVGALKDADEQFVIDGADLSLRVPPTSDPDESTFPWTLDGRWIRHAAVPAQRTEVLERSGLDGQLVVVGLTSGHRAGASEVELTVDHLRQTTARPVTLLSAPGTDRDSRFGAGVDPDEVYEGVELVGVGRPLVLADLVLALGDDPVQPDLLLEAACGGALVTGARAALGELGGHEGIEVLPDDEEQRLARVAELMGTDSPAARSGRIAAARSAYSPDVAADWLLGQLGATLGSRA